MTRLHDGDTVSGFAVNPFTHTIFSFLHTINPNLQCKKHYLTWAALFAQATTSEVSEAVLSIIT